MPHAWLSGLSGDVGMIPQRPAGSVDLSFADVLDVLDFAGMLIDSARNAPCVVYLDTTHVRTTSTETLGGVAFDRVKVEREMTTLALAVGRMVAETG